MKVCIDRVKVKELEAAKGLCSRSKNNDGISKISAQHIAAEFRAAQSEFDQAELAVCGSAAAEDSN